MARLSFAQFFIAALVFSAMSVWPHAEAEKWCNEVIGFEKCTIQACAEKCRSSHGDFFRLANCEQDYFRPEKICDCYHHY
ncbi:hypothetical protein ACJRO7_007065 [Eucalyptus globulus]|uniref:Uncharacterized protein n=1 Tax=Eucalyptus globulus TaxID=34317 RepID=A0ABD3IKZ0_EUCGL